MPFKKRIQYTFSRLCRSRNLLFFVVLLCLCCSDREEQIDFTIIWENSKAKAIRFPLQWANGIAKDSAAKYIQIRLLNDTNQTPILGDYKISDAVVFEPLLPFSHGSTYTIFVRNKKKAEFSVLAADTKDAPRIIASYPQLDTVPENLLKIYIQFSHPMMESRSAGFIKLVKNRTDTLHDAFLDLQPELWNEDRTVITLWLDPGRIKRDLQPNLKLGAPLHQSEKYKFIVSKQWKDTEGRELEKDHVWSFVTGVRDSISPDVTKWTMYLPKAASKEPLLINMNESLDHFLLMESLQVTDKNGVAVKGSFSIPVNDNTASFTPAEPWNTGNYSVRIASKLEDLSGNNLNRPFERDLLKTKQPSTQTHYNKNFVIEK
ncbi:MAG: Ig-like domain-containing protein [Bacteroidota bacterium]